jgi:hypothetical protein
MTLRFSSTVLMRNRIFGMAAVVAAAAIMVTAVPRLASSAEHPFAALTGSWTGGGVVKMMNGSSERIRCRSLYEPAGGAQLTLRLRCASDSYNLDISANVAYEGGPIAGNWSEASRNVSGNISGRSNANGSQIQAAAQAVGFNANLSISTRGARQAVLITAPGTDVSEVSITMERR